MQSIIERSNEIPFIEFLDKSRRLFYAIGIKKLDIVNLQSKEKDFESSIEGLAMDLLKMIF